MASYYFSPLGNSQQLSTAGAPLNAGTITTFQAGTNTPQATYTDNAGSNPSVSLTLNTYGLPSSPVWLLGGQAYKFVIKDSLGNLIRTLDNVSGINDPSGITTISQWVTLTAVLTFISATSFSVPTDQTGTLQVGRRLKTTNTGGTIYSTISASVFSAGVTTVTVINDSGVLDSGLSAVTYGMLSATNPSIPVIKSMVRLNTVNGYGSTNTAIRRWSTTVSSLGTDITYADSATLGGTFTINTAGVYAVSYDDNFSAVGVLGLSLNTTQPTVAFTSIATADKLASSVTIGANSEACASWTGYLTAGSVIRAHTDTTTTGTAARTYFTIVRIA